MTTTGSWIARDACERDDCTMRTYQHRHLADGTPEPAVADIEMSDGVARATDPAAGGDLAALVADELTAAYEAGAGGTPYDSTAQARRLAAAPASEAATEGEGGVQNERGDVDLIDEAWDLLTSENRDDAWEAARDRWGVRYGQNEPPRGGPDRARLLEEMWCRRVAATSREQATTEAATAGRRPSVRGRCPNCGRLELFLGEGGHITCSAAECDDPGMADDLLASAQRWGDRVRLVREPGGPVGKLPGADEVGRVLALHELGDPSDTEIDQRRKLAARVLAVVQERHRCAPPAPEVVSGPTWRDEGGVGHPDVARIAALVAHLPEQIDRAEIAEAKRSISRVYEWADGSYRVLYRAPDEPPPPLAVGEVVETAADLDRLPDGAVLRGGPQQLVMEKIGKQWSGVGNTRPVHAPDFLPACVLDLPTGGA